MRIEKDYLGELDVPKEALYGIHAKRASMNFPDQSPFNKNWYKAVGLVKLACYKTYESFINAARQKYPDKKFQFRVIENDILKTMVEAATEVSQGEYFEEFIVPAIQGGAGTSINLNINEIIANASILKLGGKPGEYSKVDPVEHANIFQSTNDVIPTSLKIAAMQLLSNLENSINKLRLKVEETETKYRNYMRIGYTQMQEAVPTSYGKLFSSYSESLSRDWWRVSKCFERIKVVNLGGSAIGTGVTVPTYFIMEVVRELQKLTDYPVTRGENLPDTTSNLDSIVEVHAIIKSHAVNLEKMVSDIRLLSSDLIENREVEISQQQVGSSIMPGKVNPVIPEFVVSAAHQVYVNDALISSLCGLGTLELNAYLPSIGNALLQSLELLIAADNTLTKNLFEGIKIDQVAALRKLYSSPSITTALLPHIGYNKATELAGIMKEFFCDIYEANEKLKFIEPSKLEEILKPDNLLKLGYRLEDVG